MDHETLARVSLWMALPLSAVGSLLHFAYDWSGRNRLVARISAVNESYWEHIKLGFWPLLLYFIVVYFLGGRSVPGFLPAAVVALYLVPITMIALVYAYKRFTKRNVLWVDILAFVVTVTLALIVFARLSGEVVPSGVTNGFALAYLAVITFAFATYTIRPPFDTDLFVDPLSGEYGLGGKGQGRRAPPD